MAVFLLEVTHSKSRLYTKKERASAESLHWLIDCLVLIWAESEQLA